MIGLPPHVCVPASCVPVEMSSYDELKMLVRTHDAHTSEVERVRREAAATLADVTRDKDTAVAAASAATAECARLTAELASLRDRRQRERKSAVAAGDAVQRDLEAAVGAALARESRRCARRLCLESGGRLARTLDASPDFCCPLTLPAQASQNSSFCAKQRRPTSARPIRRGRRSTPLTLQHGLRRRSGCEIWRRCARHVTRHGCAR